MTESSTDVVPTPQTENDLPRVKMVSDYLNEATSDQFTTFAIYWSRFKQFSPETVKKQHSLFDALKELNGIEPQYKCLCAALGCEVQDLAYYLMHGHVKRPTDMILIPDVYEDVEALLLTRLEWPDSHYVAGENNKTDTRKPNSDSAQAKAKPVFEKQANMGHRQPSKPPEMPKNSMDPATAEPAESTNVDFEIFRVETIPYKSWLLRLGGEEYYLTNSEKEIVEFLLNADQPQSVNQLKEANIKFYGSTKDKLDQIGFLMTYTKKGNVKSKYYAIMTGDHALCFTDYTLIKGAKKHPQNADITETSAVNAPIEIGALTINTHTQEIAYKGDDLVHVKGRPYEALVFMANNYGDYVTSTALSQHFFGDATPDNVARVGMGIRSLAHMIDKSCDELAQSLIMKVGDKGYALTLSPQDRREIYAKADLPDPLAPRTKPKFESPHENSNDQKGKARTDMNATNKRTVTQRQPQGDTRLSMAEQLGNLKLG